MSGILKTFFDNNKPDKDPLPMVMWMQKNNKTEVVRDILSRIDRWADLKDHESEVLLWEELMEYAEFMCKRKKVKEFPIEK